MLNLKITTPERMLYQGVIDQISLPTEQGEITILPYHIPLISSLVSGEILIKSGNDEIPIFCEGGFVEVKGKNNIMILADAGERIEEMDEEKIEQARKNAQKALKEKTNKTEHDLTMAQSLLERELIRLRITRKYRSRARSGFTQEEVLEAQKHRKI
ncbi:ATP synthase F1 subunit epsilon [bacterium]|nr:ATP synthase F1 subunit epsilon [bacterium]|tara:strand:+ start:10823 stop:11293 length:471 start_codon:yes stop_codon:yes gene_type:complete